MQILLNYIGIFCFIAILLIGTILIAKECSERKRRNDENYQDIYNEITEID